MNRTRKIPRSLWILWAFIIIIVVIVTAFYFYPETFPQNERQKLHSEVIPYDVVIIFNPGGWGNASLKEATDFTPILTGIQQALHNLGYTSIVIPYTRTPPGLSGQISDIKELLNSFQNSSRVQANDIQYLIDSFPEKKFIIAGFSNGGGLTDETIKNLIGQPRVSAIMAGVPGWYQTFSSANSLVLNNNGQDSLAVCNTKIMIATIFKAPYEWIWAKLTGRNLSLAISFEFPGHVYPWTSPQVSPPIVKFLENNFKAKTP